MQLPLPAEVEFVSVVKLTADLRTGFAAVNFRGPQGRERGKYPFASTGYAPKSRIVLRPTVDVLGLIGGTAEIFGGFGNDLGTEATITGLVTAKRLKLTVEDPATKRVLSFKGVRKGPQYSGRLRFKLPPAAGTWRGYGVRAVFGR